MAQDKKSLCRFGVLTTSCGSAGQNMQAVGYYSSNQIRSLVAEIASGASYL